MSPFFRISGFQAVFSEASSISAKFASAGLDGLYDSVKAALEDVDQSSEFTENALRKMGDDRWTHDVANVKGLWVEYAHGIRHGEFGLRVGDRGIPVRLHPIVNVAHLVGDVDVVSESAANI